MGQKAGLGPTKAALQGDPSPEGQLPNSYLLLKQQRLLPKKGHLDLLEWDVNKESLRGAFIKSLDFQTVDREEGKPTGVECLSQVLSW